jgi:hypothetical protein
MATTSAVYYQWRFKRLGHNRFKTLDEAKKDAIDMLGHSDCSRNEVVISEVRDVGTMKSRIVEWEDVK